MNYRYKNADAKNDFGAGCKDIDNGKHAWNRALEVDRTVQFNVVVVDGGPGNVKDPTQPKVKDDKTGLDRKVPVRRLDVERNALPSPASENSLFGRSSATVMRNAEDLEKQVGAAAKALAKQVDFAKEQIVVVSWTGSGAAKLLFDRVTSKGKTVVEFYVDEPPPDGAPQTLVGRLGLDFFAVPADTSVRFGKTARNGGAVEPSAPIRPKSDVQDPKIAPPGGKEKSDAELLHGAWQVVRGESGGRELPGTAIKTMRLTFNGKEVLWQFNGQEGFSTSYKNDATKKPKYINIDGGGRLPPFVGIYKLDGKKLYLAFAPKERPAGFSTNQGTDFTVYELIRADPQ